jgi:hypothetical protein
MDDYYPAAEAIPDPSLMDIQHNELVAFLTGSAEMRKTAKSSIKQSLYAGSGALAGGFFLGPVGGLIGGIAGSVLGFLQADDYDGAVLAICKLEDNRRQVLMKSVGQVLMAAGASAQQFQTSDAFRGALANLAARRDVREQLWNACAEAVRQDS